MASAVRAMSFALHDLRQAIKKPVNVDGLSQSIKETVVMKPLSLKNKVGHKVVLIRTNVLHYWFDVGSY